MNSKSLELAKKHLGKKVKVKIDRNLGSKHPKYGFEYLVNYGHLESIYASIHTYF
jgi:inorganic pyrophosphatase